VVGSWLRCQGLIAIAKTKTCKPLF
jgi:hypothetical protein